MGPPTRLEVRGPRPGCGASEMTGSLGFHSGKLRSPEPTMPGTLGADTPMSHPQPHLEEVCWPPIELYQQTTTQKECILALSNCSSSSWRSGAQAPYRSRLGWSAGTFRHVLSSHTGSSLLYLVWELRSHPFYLIKSLCNCTSAAPMSSAPSVKRSTSPPKGILTCIRLSGRGPSRRPEDAPLSLARSSAQYRDW